jgi:hypothetical protein
MLHRNGFDLIGGICVAALSLMLPACSSDDGGSVPTTAEGGVGGPSTGVDTTNSDETMSSTGTEGDTDCPPGGCLDIASDTTGSGPCDGGPCPNKIDLLFVIDNSGSMGEEQLNLAKNFPLLIQKLQDLEDSNGQPIGADVNIMVTTTDVGHTQCAEPFKPKGAPVTTGCNERISHFTGLGDNPVSIPEACTTVCPTDIVPTDDHIHFNNNGTNVPDAPPLDVNGDGIDDNNIAQALACLGPVGIDGCGYEAPLEAILQALNANAEWNTGDTPFLRDDAVLAIALITDEADCSVMDFTIFDSQNEHWESHPTLGAMQSSAICWNAGVDCVDANNDGSYEECFSVDNGLLQPVEARYVATLNAIRNSGKEVVMLGILGIPEVTAHAEDPPHQPTAGGVFSLEYRDWIDGLYPGGDILPEDWNDGETAAHKEWAFGIGPGCTGVTDTPDVFTGQAIPPVRVKEVCESLNYDDKIRCCMESICDEDFSAAMTCLTDTVQDALVPIG